MKTISRLLILCLLLTGCAKEETVEPVFTPAETVAIQGLYDAGSNLEISSLGAIQVYPLSSGSGRGMLPFGDGILLFSGDTQTTLTLFTGDTLVPAASKQLEFSLNPENCTIHENNLSFFDPEKEETTVLDKMLEPISTIPAPNGLVGVPLLSSDRSTLYYCTQRTIQAWDLEAGIHRILRQTAASSHSAKKLYCDDTILRCDTEDGCFFIATDTGTLLHMEDTQLKLTADNHFFVAATWETNLWSLIFQSGGETKALTPRNLSAQYYLLDGTLSVVTAAPTGEVVTLDHYDLTSGKRTASQMIRGGIPQSMIEKDGYLWILMYLADYESQALLRWDPGKTPVSDPQIYTGPHFTAQNPDREGLETCQDYADEIGDRYGLNILLWQEGAALAPEGIAVKPEHRVNILMRELELLDHRLSQFPEGLLKDTAANFDRLNIGLVAHVSSIQGSGYQFFSGRDANILLAVGADSERALYHHLFHVMQTHILNNSSAFDLWDTINPQGFRYDYDYAANAIRNSGIYLTADNRYFLDTFSMSYPIEDRARIFEFAMLPGNESLFKGKYMQKKLKAVCLGIREAYRLLSDAAYPWEQYLG